MRSLGGCGPRNVFSYRTAAVMKLLAFENNSHIATSRKDKKINEHKNVPQSSKVMSLLLLGHGEFYNLVLCFFQCVF